MRSRKFSVRMNVSAWFMKIWKKLESEYIWLGNEAVNVMATLREIVDSYNFYKPCFELSFPNNKLLLWRWCSYITLIERINRKF